MNLQLRKILGMVVSLMVISLPTQAKERETHEPSTVPRKCEKCHDEEVDSFGKSTHSKAWAGHADIDLKNACSTCHGPGEKHSMTEKKEDIISFTKGSSQTPQEQSKQCLSCHSTKTKELMFWNQGIHNRNDVSCVSCHNMHKGTEASKPTIDTCFKCHKDLKVQANKYSHHPIVEGKVTCGNCHNPHGSMSHGNLVTENVNQLCYKCHTDKRGPFLYQHPPVEEDCMICHSPHGSNHAKLLITKLPNLCQDCHDNNSHRGQPFGSANTFLGNAPKAQLFARACLNCHGHIHGSNVPGGHGHDGLSR